MLVTAYGIYATQNSIVYNYDWTKTSDGAVIMISVNPETGAETVRMCVGKSCNKEPYVKLESGSTFESLYDGQEGIVSDTSAWPSTVLGHTVLATAGAKFEIEGSLSGDIMMSSDIVSTGFAETYTVPDMVNADDVSNLNLYSQSVLFDAKLQNNTDAVLTMKPFDEVVDNSSVADFLKQNYVLGNNEEMFNLLKEQDSLKSLRRTIDSLTGADVFNRFNFEDMTMMRELNMDINNKLFNNNASHLTTSGSIAPFYFDGNSGSNGRYALYNTRIGKNSYGLSLAFTNVNSRDRRDDNSRKDETFQMSVPFGYKTHGFQFITAPRFGYAYGTYDRNGYERTYDGTVEKRMFGLMETCAVGGVQYARISS